MLRRTMFGCWAGYVGVGVVGAFACSAMGTVVTLNPQKDATIIQENSAIANGSGLGLFAGNIGAGVGFARRGLVQFDTSGIPAGSTINSVSVVLTLTRAHATATPTDIGLFRIITGWNEGPSHAGSSSGAGSFAVTGDVTWAHTYFSDQFWTTPGGDIAGVASAIRTIGTTLTAYTWNTNAALVADVQAWVNNPGTNFGWMLKGNEAAATTTRRFASREVSNASQRPKVIIDYTPVPAPGAIAMAGMGVVLAARRRRQ